MRARFAITMAWKTAAAAAGLLVLGAVLPARAGEAEGDAPRPYIFTQVHDGYAQDVPVGARIEVQLPGEPTVWSLDPEKLPKNLKALGRKIIPSPGRIEGTKSIYQFDFEAIAQGDALIVLTADPPSPVPPAHEYRLTLHVKTK